MSCPICKSNRQPGDWEWPEALETVCEMHIQMMIDNRRYMKQQPPDVAEEQKS